jgi:hypothetical protein
MCRAGEKASEAETSLNTSRQSDLLLPFFFTLHLSPQLESICTYLWQGNDSIDFVFRSGDMPFDDDDDVTLAPSLRSWALIVKQERCG